MLYKLDANLQILHTINKPILKPNLTLQKCKLSTLSQRNLLKFNEIKNSPKPNLSTS
nr:hypothetical protein [uncultured Campylobacter sp.]